MAPAGDQRGTVAESSTDERTGETDPAAAEHAEHPASFDPGTETGYLRRGARGHELDPEVGAEPFDPGPQHYDGRRAKRAERRREKAERKRREKSERQEREREQAAMAERKERARSNRERLDADRGRREAAARAARERESEAEVERERAVQERLPALEQADSRKPDVRERIRAQREERERAEAERRAEKERARAERDAAARAQRQERQREREQREERERAERKLAASRRRERAQKRRRPEPQSKPNAQPAAVAAVAAEPAVAEAHQRRAAAKRAARRPPAAPRRETSLRWPTAKAGVALAAVAVVAVGAGVLLGLPLPLVGNSDGPDTSLADSSVLTLDPGTPKGLTKGPYHPVVASDPDYGEAAAKFGADRGGRRHEGQDIFARPGTPLVAVRDGIVLDGGGGKSFYSYGGGNTLAIYSPLDDRSYIYLHMLKPAVVRAGEQVKAGQLVGQVGCTGSCDGPHLHFEIRQGRAVYGPQKKPLDPLPLLRDWPVRPVDNGQ
jgi:murein DD-endopeptidase MepM/ murein hydrolase activator NlpD